MTECKHTEVVYSVSSTIDTIVGVSKCKHCEEVVKEVTVEKNILDILDVESANEVIELLKD